MSMSGGKTGWPTDLGPRMRLALSQAGPMVGQALVKRAQDGMKQPPKSGRIYPHPKGGTYQASAFGEYSAVVTGALVGSVGYRLSGPGYIAFYATAKHAGYQEFGTSKMDPRANLARAIRESDGEIRNLVDSVLWRAIGRG